MLRTQDLAELPQEELDQRITLTWRHVGVMLHLRLTHFGIAPLELPGQWRPVTVQHLQKTAERLRKYKRKYNKLRGVVPECPTISGSSSSDSFLNVLNRINLFWGPRPPMKVFTSTYKDMYTAALMVGLDER